MASELFPFDIQIAYAWSVSAINPDYGPDSLSEAIQNMQRYNLIPCVREEIKNMGASVVRVCDAINAALGELKAIKSTDKLGVGAAQLKRAKYKVTNTVATQYEGKLTVPLHFDAWHCKLEACNKVAEIPAVGIPLEFHEWIAKFVPESKAEIGSEEEKKVIEKLLDSTIEA